MNAFFFKSNLNNRNFFLSYDYSLIGKGNICEIISEPLIFLPSFILIISISYNLENVSKSVPSADGDAPNRLLIDNFTFTLGRGDIVGIIGPNGVGKTTLLKMIAGEEKPDQGEVKIGNTVVCDDGIAFSFICLCVIFFRELDMPLRAEEN